ncbi:MAG: TRAP transporter substrate-binding protein [Proteobacteria bacterium]|nr:TRAP transporter substrate-binding protein [Pseudomonadota bacterium]
MTNKQSRSILGVCAAAIALAFGAGPSAAQDKPVELKFAHWLPAAHPLATLGFIPWAKSVEAASKGSIKVTIYPAQQLGKAANHYDMARDGIADITWANPGYQAERFPIFGVAELPFQFSTPGAGSKALDAWYRGYAAKEMKEVQFCLAHLHIGTLHSKKPITDPALIKGMKIRPSHGTMAQYITLLGGTNVQVSAPESRDALEKGIADAITFPSHSMITFGIDKVIKYHADMRLYAATFAWTMNKDSYQKLSATQKKVIDDHCNNEWAAKIGADWGNDEDSGLDKLSKTPGHTIVKLTDAQLSTWRKAAEPMTADWLKKPNNSGIDAKEALESFRKALKTHNAAY